MAEIQKGDFVENTTWKKNELPCMSKIGREGNEGVLGVRGQGTRANECVGIGNENGEWGLSSRAAWLGKVERVERVERGGNPGTGLGQCTYGIRVTSTR
jgi:hypothetical protein